MENKMLVGLLSILSQPLINSNVVVCLTGDGVGRMLEGLKLLKEGWAKNMLIVGSNSLLSSNPQAGADEIKNFLVLNNVEAWGVQDRITTAEGANTLEQAENASHACKKENWKTGILVASSYHLPRAFLTFLNTLEKMGHEMKIIPHASPSPWYGKNEEIAVEPAEGGRRFLEEELPRIVRYQEKGDITSWTQLEEYFRKYKM